MAGGASTAPASARAAATAAYARILPFVKEGDTLYAGRRFGLIRFGSRVDVYLPPGVTPLVAEGQTMIAGETVMADLTASLPPRPARAE